ncbi:MAG: DNA-binding protein [Oscillospiraceae bacterium]
MAEKQYERLLSEYPEYISKEQLYRICHVSKRTALHYLENGFIPATSTGKKTRKYKIAIKDVVDFLIERDKHPKRYLAPNGWYQGTNGYKRKPRFFYVRLNADEDTKIRLAHWLENYSDVMKSKDVSKATGYEATTVIDWCATEKLHHFTIRRTFFIPKLSLIDFMLSDNFNGIKVKPSSYEDFIASFNKS